MDEKTLVKRRTHRTDMLKSRNVQILSWNGKTGIIIDETKNTFLIEIDNKRKKIAKNIAKFEFEYDGKKIILEWFKNNI